MSQDDHDIYIPMQPTAPDIFVPPDSFVPVPPPPNAFGTGMASAPPKKVGLDNLQLDQLHKQGYTKGLAQALSENCTSFPLRIWIVDNSGSMNMCDGQKLVATASSSEVKSVSCTRWKEIQETVDYHASMAALLKAPTIFRLLNDPRNPQVQQEFSIGQRGEDFIEEDLREAHRMIQLAAPTGVTPLARHIRQVKEEVESMAPSLQAEGKRVALILATDGLPSDERGGNSDYVLEEFTNALRSLEGLPLWIVVRLCTDDVSVVDYYNELDSQLELSIEVLDNFTGEAQEMFQANPWINYTLQIHRMRELGFQHRIFDLLDERMLTIGELREYCFLLFGDDNFDGVPEPEVDLKGFVTAIDQMMKNEKKQWHPIKKKMKPLVSCKKLSTIYGDGSCAIM